VKKGCLIGLAVLLVLVIAAIAVIGIAYVKLNSQYGISEAAAVSHETLATKDTRARVVVKPDKLAPFVFKYIKPEDIPQLPKLPSSPDALISMVVPREIALLEGAEYSKGSVGLTLFINERRFGPEIVKQLNQQGLQRTLNMIKWDEGMFTMPQRGVVLVNGALPIPDGLEEKVLETWKHDLEGNPVVIDGDHLLELALDNRNGEIMTLIGAGAKAAKQDWKMLMENSYVQTGLAILPNLHVLRLSADVVEVDKAEINLRVEGTQEAGNQLEFLVNMMGLPLLKQYLEDDFGMKLDGQPKWDAGQKAFIGAFTLTGFEPLIRAQIQQFIPPPPAPAAKKS